MRKLLSNVFPAMLSCSDLNMIQSFSMNGNDIATSKI